jgi:hypothetical protein
MVGAKVQPKLAVVEYGGLSEGTRTRSVPSAEQVRDTYADLREGRLVGQLNTGPAPGDTGGRLPSWFRSAE